MLGASSEWRPVLPEGFRPEHSVPVSVGVRALHVIQNIPLTKTAEREFCCTAELHQRKAVQEGRGFNCASTSSFSASLDIVVVCLQMFMEKQELSSFPFGLLCCADSTEQSGRVSNQHSALTQQDLNLHPIRADISLLPLEGRRFSAANWL